MKKRILLTGARLPFTVDLARQLNAAGHTVVIADPWKWHFCRYSNAVAKNLVVPSPRHDPKAFVDGLVNVCREEKIDLLIPTFEEVLYVSQGLALFPKETRIFCSPFNQMVRLHNKWKFYKRQCEFGINAPHTVVVENETQLKHLPFEGAYALKSVYSRAGLAIFKVEKGKAPPKVRFNPQNPWIAQEWLEGNRFCTYSVCYEGKLRAHTCYPVEFAVDGHYCLTFRSVVHEGILRWVEHFIQKENYTGQVGFDFIEVPGRGILAIEANPRATNGVCLFEPQDHLAEAFFSSEGALIAPEEGRRRQLWLPMLSYGWRVISEHYNWRSYLSYLLRTPDIIFDKKDIKPFLMQIPMGFNYAQRAKKLGVSLADMATWDSAWNGE
ncbi:MAG: ATP-grasp domain-containing protein [Verrucomicrobia bacterium]|nr:ATP-grasp domain-containing protein [Verrucomicrobiota bacterium]